MKPSQFKQDLAISKMSKSEKQECYGTDMLPMDGELRYQKLTKAKNPYPINPHTDALCDPYSTKYLPKGSNHDPLNVSKVVDNRDASKRTGLVKKNTNPDKNYY